MNASSSIQPRLLTDFEPQIFQELYNFDIAKKILEQLDKAVAALGDIICAHNFERVVGVNLLHKHYDILEGERVVREYEGRVATMKPRIISGSNSSTTKIIPYLWQYADGPSGSHYYPLEFAEYSGVEITDAMADIQMIGTNHRFLQEFADLLLQLGLEDIFGFAALSSRVNVTLNDGETLLETTDFVNRILTLEPVLESELPESDTTETLWTFSSPKTEETE